MSLIEELSLSNQQRWEAAKLTRQAEFHTPVSRIVAAQNRYELIQRRTGVHWTFIACTHYRESNLDFSRQLAQGDPLSRVSTHVPKGRGPFSSFEDGAYDALVNCSPYAARNSLWSQSDVMPGMLTLLEMYNGLGYAKRGVPSPYIWSGTDQYVKGKYISDGQYSASTVDKQLGVAGILRILLEAQPALFGKEATPIAPTPPKPLPEPPSAAVCPSTLNGPVLNKAGEDITPHLNDFYQTGLAVWDWIRHH